MTTTRTLALVSSKESFTHECDINVKTARLPLQHPLASHLDGLRCDCRNRAAFFLTTDSSSGNKAADLAAAHGLSLQTLFPKEGLPCEASALLVALDELLLDAHGRREYLGELKELKLPYPVVILSYDFQLEPLTTERPGLMLAARLGEEVFTALGYGRIDPTDYKARKPAA
jgi:hypothetical protein